MTKEVLLNLFLIVFITVNILDISGFLTELEIMLGKWLGVKNVKIPKPFSCSYCMSWWIGLSYLIISMNANLISVSILLIFCSLTTNIADIMYMVKDWITMLINKLH